MGAASQRGPWEQFQKPKPSPFAADARPPRATQMEKMFGQQAGSCARAICARDAGPSGLPGTSEDLRRHAPVLRPRRHRRQARAGRRHGERRALDAGSGQAAGGQGYDAFKGLPPSETCYRTMSPRSPSRRSPKGGPTPIGGACTSRRPSRGAPPRSRRARRSASRPRRRAAAGFSLGSAPADLGAGHQKAIAEGLSHEAAADRAIKESGIAAVFGRGRWG